MRPQHRGGYRSASVAFFFSFKINLRKSVENSFYSLFLNNVIVIFTFPSAPSGIKDQILMKIF